MRETNRRVIDQFRAGGPIDGMHRERLLLLTTTGERTGRARTTPLMVHREGDRLFVIASNVGARRDPDWCGNLRADPHVTVEVAEETFDAAAAELDGDDRAAVWERILAAYPFFGDHAAAAAPRRIPVVELTRR